jgi:lipoprotein-anchoring transpeptidase ErfK/SrfK
MHIRKTVLRSATALTAACAALWLGSAVAAPQPPSYPAKSATLFASVMHYPTPLEESEANAPVATELRRQVVDYATPASAGTIIIDTGETYLYYVLGDGKAIRYGIGVGRDGFTWSGAQTVTRMAEWPDWTPPQEMIARQPFLPRWMAGGQGNPLGARAIYLGTTVYRIHGTNAPETLLAEEPRSFRGPILFRTP